MSRSSGFTLVELSVVLVIIGLIIGGVLVGKDLIYGSKLRSTISNIEKIKSAVYTFRNKYGGLPGDLSDAYQYWGSACGPNGSNGTNTIIVTAGSGIVDSNACNGNNNGYIEFYSDRFGEDVKFWQHLSLAGLIEGKYLGYRSAGGSTGLNTPGSIIPAGMDNTAYSIRYAGIQQAYVSAGITTNIYKMSGNFISWGAYDAGSTNDTGIGFMTARQAYAFDSKFDDGEPTTGNIVATMGVYNGVAQAGCVSNWIASVSSSYVLTDTNAYCQFYFPLGS